ncbi:hypothetical protein [Halomicrobium sp. LC1Hm]|uniref:hypothetical protein n=1 Tax=Halomicrobium sp. LC1Hm TaxID=2610902 RepID=UPI0012A97AC1|nr:hypothetical protein [Halomicrobium sp. LC1Hm]QGA83706.1 Uncharacterized protein LC1Hm_2673 [Halomicrobium sp. LC1Hm]
MTHPKKSLDPADRLGVYKRLSDVPSRYRLHHHAEAYESRDTWQEFCEEYEYKQGSHDGYEAEVDRAGSDWKNHMATSDRHHALATPEDVEAWCANLLADKSERRTYDYWLRVNRFYDWLQWHSEHPHVYNPVLMAAVVGDATKRVWRWKARQNRQSRAEYRRQKDE